MKNIQEKRDEVKSFVANLYMNGSSPAERFGMSWSSLSKLEDNVPELTCKTNHNDCKTA
ncbi:hypothetical protein KI743_06515 [Vibrio sp. D420a]|uniref:hypothetical protein n=1 Tax=Vibrio TaxID=662 RepID=UPI0017871197|nr:MULTISPECIES: hypothetical protein [Vibrio]MDK9761647.1 hypothetical protein [Vibrio sp. D420a]